MVYEEDTKELCHGLTELGKEAYQELIASEADRILVESEHRFLKFFVKLFDAIGFTDSFILERYDRLLLEMRENRL